ncbi:uncharacterized protein Z518_07272 [Rhinocladiella mackenziei CBS 650.93]|uniref:Major facilitator superfamily (MFS) profile domain-containing protein n=1 Tax=Rhinocladiella mackenziei CBS 650.93 TaxID=1442369 RepID=A0A0D2ICZ2_9EURO|nr:uncharacterized protein Z518_07272 [Rhinocladiella mackenziei CBS 650.93]KIX03719.1 hypothetical protein Z518_07272 [Rhinocladiella mackenziei CBS 650.93]
MVSDTRDVVPGTIHLVDTEHHTSHHHDIVLNPRPSADPEDPLNWKPWRKQLAIWMVYTYIFGLAIATTVQYSILADIAEETGISIANLNTGTGLMFLFLGWGCLIWQPIGLVFGRRGVYVLTSLLTIGPMVWTAYTRSAGEWYAHRILIGLACAPVESLPEVSVPDLFFAHERGFYIGIYALFVFGGNALAPFLAGFVADAYGWRAAIWFGTIVLAVTTVIIYFGLEETMYFRETIEGVDEGDAIHEERQSSKIVSETDTPTEKNGPVANVESGLSSPPAERVSRYPKPRTYLQKLSLFQNLPGRPSVKQMFVMMYRPLLVFFYFPSVDWSGFLYGSNLSWYTVVNATMSLILSGAPYNFAPSMVGTSYLSVFTGALLGALWAGWVGDKVALYLARRNGGIREPEHRLWTLLVSGAIGAGGFILWGVGAAHQVHYMGLIIGVGMVEFAVVAGASAAISYDVDCFKEIAGETLILVIVIRNTMGFGFSYGITPWLDDQGLVKTFVAVGMLSLACTFSFLIFIFFGKKLRKLSAKKYWQYVDTLVGGGAH